MDGSEGLETTLESLLAHGRGYNATGGEGSAEWEVEDDPDLVNEPLLQLDMQVRSNFIIINFLDIEDKSCTRYWCL